MLYTVIFYLVLSVLSLGVIYIFKKKSDKELRELGQEDKKND